MHCLEIYFVMSLTTDGTYCALLCDVALNFTGMHRC